MNESQTTASKNEIDDSVEFASAVKTQQVSMTAETTERSIPYTATIVLSDLGLDTSNFILLKICQA